MSIPFWGYLACELELGLGLELLLGLELGLEPVDEHPVTATLKTIINTNINETAFFIL